jgi:hypothetical protein
MHPTTTTQASTTPWDTPRARGYQALLDALLLGKYKEFLQDQNACSMAGNLSGLEPQAEWGSNQESKNFLSSVFLAVPLRGKGDHMMDDIIDIFEAHLFHGSRRDLLNMLPITEGEKKFAMTSREDVVNKSFPALFEKVASSKTFN